MSTMHRRALAGILLGSTALAACSGNSPPPTPASVATDVSTIASALNAVVAQVGALGIPGFTPALAQQVGVYAADLETLAASVASAATATAAQPLVKQIEGYVNSIVSVLAALPLPANIAAALQAAAVLLPVVEAAIGLVASPAPATSRMRAAAPTMTADQARLILRAAPLAK